MLKFKVCFLIMKNSALNLALQNINGSKQKHIFLFFHEIDEPKKKKKLNTMLYHKKYYSLINVILIYCCNSH